MLSNPIEIQPFLNSTKLINFYHPKIQSQAKEITTDCSTHEEKAQNIFYYIRDKIRYEFRVKFTEEEYFASNIIEVGRGFCTQKAILFCALARSCNIPAGIYFYDIIDHTLPAYILNYMKTNVLYHHGIAALFINGKWNKYDATLDKVLIDRINLKPVEFSPNKDCLMHEKTKKGEKHIEYIKDYGMVSDVSTEQIIDWFDNGYPELTELMRRSSK